MNTKLPAVTDAESLPIRFSMTAGQVSDYTVLLADLGHDADGFGEPLKANGIKPCIPRRKSPDKPINHDRRCYQRRNRIEILFGRQKNWRRVATRHDRCRNVFLSAIALAATIKFWL
jgi:transposase